MFGSLARPTDGAVLLAVGSQVAAVHDPEIAWLAHINVSCNALLAAKGVLYEAGVIDT
jgi:hypothetical protein